MHYILITGGNGYIGSHIAKAFAQKGYSIIIVDKISKKWDGYINVISEICDITNLQTIDKIFSKYKTIDIVIHCAGELGIENSYKDPCLFYDQNVYGTEVLLRTMGQYNVKKIIFSSSAAVYPFVKCAVKENMELTHKMSPYALSKRICEINIELLKKYMGIQYTIFRYFNVVGCDTNDSQLLSQYLKKGNIIPRLINSLLDNSAIYIYGHNYTTMDGTCVRDYIHVTDLAELHVQAYNKMNESNFESGIYNAGSGISYSNLELVNICEKITRKKIEVIFCGKREGDTPVLQADMSKTFSTFDIKYKCDINYTIGSIYNVIKGQHSS